MNELVSTVICEKIGASNLLLQDDEPLVQLSMNLCEQQQPTSTVRNPLVKAREPSFCLDLLLLLAVNQPTLFDTVGQV